MAGGRGLGSQCELHKVFVITKVKSEFSSVHLAII